MQHVVSVHWVDYSTKENFVIRTIICFHFGKHTKYLLLLKETFFSIKLGSVQSFVRFKAGSGFLSTEHSLFEIALLLLVQSIAIPSSHLPFPTVASLAGQSGSSLSAMIYHGLAFSFWERVNWTRKYYYTIATCWFSHISW